MAGSKAEEALVVQLRALRIGGYAREYRFDSERKWRFDFAWPAELLAVEIEGGLWVNGRHTRPVGFENDCEKYNAAQLAGWTVLRYTPGQVRSGVASKQIGEFLGG